MPKVDLRLVRVTIFINGVQHVYEKVAIEAKGTKHETAIQNFAEIRIANIDKDTREKLLTEGTPWAAARPQDNTILIEAGRESYGLFQIFRGHITTVNASQVPDIWLTIRAVTFQGDKWKTIAVSQKPLVKYSELSQQVADILGIPLEFSNDVEDKNIAKFSFSGATTKLVDVLGKITHGVRAYINDDRLVIKKSVPSIHNSISTVSLETGMIGYPEFSDLGVTVRVFANPAINLGDDIDLISENYPSTNGIYHIYQLDFDITNRSGPFYYSITAGREQI